MEPAMAEEREERRIRIKLFCPSLSKIIQVFEWEDQKLDLGSIARAFGLEPHTVKLNGHFICRGVDFIASSVTWKSLIGFFSARGLSTGASDSDALIVQGKLGRCGSKREHDVLDDEKEILNENGPSYVGNSKKPQLECHSMLNNDVKETKSDVNTLYAFCSGPNDLGLKRKLSLEDAGHLKRSRSDTVSGLLEDSCSASPNRIFQCSFISKSVKRMRDDEMFAYTPFKKIK